MSKTGNMKVIMIHDIVEKNGKTIKENNLEKKHNIPIGSLVEVKYDNWFGNGACEKVHARLWVVSHDRDCDGTPLYALCNDMQYIDSTYGALSRVLFGVKSGFSEESLQVMEVSKDIKYGNGSLGWD